MKNRSLRYLSLIAALCVAGMVVVQAYWLVKAFDLRERQFHQNVQLVLQQVAEDMRAYAQLPPFGQSPVVQLSSNYYAVMINDQVDPGLLEGLLTRELLRRNLQLDYEYGIYDCNNEKLVYGNYVNLQQQDAMPSKQLPTWPLNNYYFSVYFPTKAGYLAQGMDIWIFSSCVMLLVVAFFIYTTFVLLRQKRYSEVQKDFINTITHEVKTPVTTIMLSAEALQRQMAEPVPHGTHIHTYVQLIQQEARRIKNQVEQVLQSAHVEKEKLHLNKQPLDLHTLITEVSESMDIMLKQYAARLVLDLKAQSSVILGDRLHLTNVLFNLIDNACKYSLAAPEIRICTENKKGQLWLRVCDKGRGIAREEQKKVFERFYRISAEEGATVKGFGLGLYYVKNVMKAHQGQIQLESGPGQGSTFSLRFPKPILA